MPELIFVAGQSPLDPLADLAEALAAEVSRQDAVASVVATFPEPRADRIAVIFDGDPYASRELGSGEMSRSVAVVTKSPGSGEFRAAADLAARVGASFHVNSTAVADLHRAGVPARHLQLGYSSAWPERSVRADGLAVLEGDGYFDWVMALASIHRGEVVLHERCLGMAPLVAGRHLFVAAPESIDPVAEILRQDRERLAKVRELAAAFTREALPLALAAAALIGAARVLVAQPFAPTDGRLAA